MAEVVVVATMKAGEGNVDTVLEAIKEVAAETHAEEGCITYAVHQGAQDPNTVVLVERWRSQEDLDAHFRQAYVAALGEQASLLAEPPQVHFLGAVPAGQAEKGRL